LKFVAQGNRFRAWLRIVASAIAGCAFVEVGAASAQQFVVTEATYTATVDNTMDSHFYEPPAKATPSNWTSPVDYSKGTAYVRLEVLSKPSTKKTLYNVCFEGNSGYCCMGYPPPYTAPGVVNFSGSLPSFWNYSTVDWSKGLHQMALILKDENGNKVQGDASFYPTKIHVTITVVAPGGTYVPPSEMMNDAGMAAMDAGKPDSGPADAGRPAKEKDAGHSAADAGAPHDADGGGSKPADSGMRPAMAGSGATQHDSGVSLEPVGGAHSSAGAAGSAHTSTGGSSGSAPTQMPKSAVKGGCATVAPSGHETTLSIGWLALTFVLAGRSSRRRKARQLRRGA
jgi:hypothetical protein